MFHYEKLERKLVCKSNAKMYKLCHSLGVDTTPTNPGSSGKIFLTKRTSETWSENVSGENKTLLKTMHPFATNACSLNNVVT